jgi:hypothetical protein
MAQVVVTISLQDVCEAAVRMKAKPASLALYIFSICVQAASADYASIKNAVGKYFPTTTWRERSIVTGDFTCSGKEEWAILGTNTSEILIAVFINGASSKPEILHYSRSERNAATAVLSTEGMDYDPPKDIGYVLPGFERSKTCKGLDLSDGKVDSAHIYWNHKAKRFADWSR